MNLIYTNIIMKFIFEEMPYEIFKKEGNRDNRITAKIIGITFIHIEILPII